MKLAKREKYFVGIAVCSLALFFLLQFLIFPFFEKRERLQKGVKIKEEALREIIKLSAEYEAYRVDSKGVQQLLTKRPKGFTLFAFLDRAAGEAGIKERIEYMKPSTSKGTGPYKESMVEMKLEAVTLKQLTEYLHRIESPEDLISVKRISIKQNKREAGYLDAVLQALTYE